MRGLILVFITFFVSMSIDAQTKNTSPQSIQESVNVSADESNNELKINGLWLILGAFDISYEYLLNEESAVGLEVYIPFDDEVNDEIQYYISPYYRKYFGNTYAAGFFIEGFAMLNSTERRIFTSEDDFVTNLALGIGLGGKWITNSNFIGEINFGIGRNLLNNDSDYEFLPKLGFTIGYRF